MTNASRVPDGSALSGNVCARGAPDEERVARTKLEARLDRDAHLDQEGLKQVGVDARRGTELATRELHQAKQEMVAIYASRSWRFSKPLRIAGTVARVGTSSKNVARRSMERAFVWLSQRPRAKMRVITALQFVPSLNDRLWKFARLRGYGIQRIDDLTDQGLVESAVSGRVGGMG